MKAIKKNPKQLLMLSVICFTLLLVLSEPAKSVEYEYTELLPPGWIAASNFSYGFSRGFNHIINDDGVVVGTGYKTYTDTWGPLSGFIYYQGEYTELLPPGWQEAIVNGINNNGEVVGTGVIEQPETKGFIFKDGIYTEVLPPGFSDEVRITAINEKGMILGTGYNIINDEGEVFVYQAGKYKTMRYPLLPPTVGLQSIFDINDYGTIVGSCSTGSWLYPGKVFGFIYRGGIYTWLSPKNHDFVEATAINNRGQVVGRVEEEFNGTGFIYHCGIYRWLNVPGMTNTEPSDINNRGEVVGTCANFHDGVTKGFVYSKGTYTELLPPGWIYALAISINNNGIVIGCGADSNQIQKMFIAEPQSD